MAQIQPELNFKSKIEELLRGVIQEQREEVIKDAVAEFELRVREKMGQSVLKILDVYSIERLGNQILIRVDIKSAGTEGKER